jgi:diadenosine tetraphosphate (Ap4A) HIT family hydrolase
VITSFTEIPEKDWGAQNALAFAIRDKFPVSPGHSLVIMRRVVECWFEATPAEREALVDLVDTVRRQLDESHQPDGYNIGINVGAAAGQTVPHLHVHARCGCLVSEPR